MKSKFIVLAIVLVACGPSPDQIQTAIAETQAAQPTATLEPTATPVPLSEVDIASILIVDGDLPASLKPGQFPSQGGYAEMPDADQLVARKFDGEGMLHGEVTAWLYSDLADVATGYAFLSGVVTDIYGHAESFDGLGEQAIGTAPEIQDLSVVLSVDFNVALPVEVVFRRCQALAQVVMPYGAGGIKTAVSYAVRLDGRLRQLVCP